MNFGATQFSPQQYVNFGGSGGHPFIHTSLNGDQKQKYMFSLLWAVI